MPNWRKVKRTTAVRALAKNQFIDMGRFVGPRRPSTATQNARSHLLPCEAQSCKWCNLKSSQFSRPTTADKQQENVQNKLPSTTRLQLNNKKLHIEIERLAPFPKDNHYAQWTNS